MQDPFKFFSKQNGKRPQPNRAIVVCEGKEKWIGELGLVRECCGESYWGMYMAMLNYYEKLIN